MGVSVLAGAYILAKRAKNTRFISLRGGGNMALVRSVSDLVTGVVNGVAGALMPIVGVYFGERDWGSIHGVLCRRAARTGGIITAAFAIGAALLSGLICGLFNITDPAALSAARRGLVYLAASFVFGFVNLMCVGYFNTVRRPMLSNLILGLRTLVCLAPGALIMSRALGIDGVWLALAAADALTTLIVLAAVARDKAQKPHPRRPAAGQEPPARERDKLLRREHGGRRRLRLGEDFRLLRERRARRAARHAGSPSHSRSC